MNIMFDTDEMEAGRREQVVRLLEQDVRERDPKWLAQSSLALAERNFLKQQIAEYREKERNA